ncbi:PAS domain-containing protein, partial [Escherichia coli]
MRHLDGQGVLRDTLSPSVRWLDVYIDEADRATVLAAVAEAIAREDTFELEHRVRLAEGGFGWVLSRA